MSTSICGGGNLEKCCCTPNGNDPCKYLEENTVDGRRWSCGLMRELGDWDLVITDKRYRKDVAPILETAGMDCKSFPREAKCYLCGANCE